MFKLYFNPRLPRGWRPGRRGHNREEDVISIHATRVGGDEVPEVVKVQRGISIHASRVGGDTILKSPSSNLLNFNPRLPRGWRLRRSAPEFYPVQFQSTPPAWVATGVAV